jgi:hypothetical protein
MSKHQDLQKILFGEIVFDNDFHKIRKMHEDVKDDDDFDNGKYKRYNNRFHKMIYLNNEN